jgi:hypothetical protein
MDPNKSNRNKNPVEFGYIWEEEIFGRSSKGNSATYLDYGAALADAIRRQEELRWDPDHPKTFTANELFECVRSYLPKHLAERLQLFCSVGTALDYHHGIDGFFFLAGIVVSMDLSYRPKKRSIKADFEFPRTMANSRLWRVGKQIAEKFIEEFK